MERRHPACPPKLLFESWERSFFGVETTVSSRRENSIRSLMCEPFGGIVPPLSYHQAALAR